MKTIDLDELIHVVGGQARIQLPAPAQISKLPAQLPGPKLPPAGKLIMPRGGWPYKSAGWWELARKSGNIR